MAAQVMPPATAWKQERWDIREVPRFWPPSPRPEFSPEELEYKREQRKLGDEYFQQEGLEVGQSTSH